MFKSTPFATGLSLLLSATWYNASADDLANAAAAMSPPSTTAVVAEIKTADAAAPADTKNPAQPPAISFTEKKIPAIDAEQAKQAAKNTAAQPDNPSSTEPKPVTIAHSHDELVKSMEKRRDELRKKMQVRRAEIEKRNQEREARFAALAEQREQQAQAWREQYEKEQANREDADAETDLAAIRKQHEAEMAEMARRHAEEMQAYREMMQQRIDAAIRQMGQHPPAAMPYYPPAAYPAYPAYTPTPYPYYWGR